MTDGRRKRREKRGGASAAHGGHGNAPGSAHGRHGNVPDPSHGRNGDTPGAAHTRHGNAPDVPRPEPGAISEGASRFARGVTPLPPLRDISQLPLPELLLPAGSPVSLEAAIEAGADAVYFGARSYSARARAGNFDEKDISGAMRLCRAYGVRAYAAVNTRIRDAELGDALNLVEFLLSEGADALIVADAGLGAMIRRTFGEDVELHASTQLTPVSSYDASALAELGFSRVVAPRELTLGALAELCRKSPVGIEAFIHGAHCVSLSGQCLLSSVIGGRSANRGECAQPCRMQYVCGKRSGALLSLADMCLAPDIPAVISTGVQSLKVEGRQKDASYVLGVGRLYRRLLDGRRSASPDEIGELAELFERGFTDGYLRGEYRDMCGVRRDDAPRVPAFGGLKKRVPLDASLTVRTGAPAILRMTAGGRLSAEVASGTAAAAAQDGALTSQRAKQQISRLGGTPFVLGNFGFDTDGAAWLSAAQLNELRRRAVDMLTRPHRGALRASAMPEGAAGGCPAAPDDGSAGWEQSARTEEIAAPERAEVSAPQLTASFTCAAQIPAEAYRFFDAIYLPYTELLPGESGAVRSGVHLSLPPYMTDSDAARIAPMIGAGERVLVHSVGQIEFVRGLGAIPDASFRLNVWNTECARVIVSLCAPGTVTLSPELGAAALRHISRATGGAAAVVYGKLPVMYTVRCMIRSANCRGGHGGMTGAVRSGEPCRAYLRDRTGAQFFVLGTRDCANEIYNSVPTWTADRPLAGCREHFVFSDESAEQVLAVIEAYRNESAPRHRVRRGGK